MTSPWTPSRPFPPEWPGPRPAPSVPSAPPAALPAYYVPIGQDAVAERLMDERIILAYGHLDDARATAWCAQLLTLDATGTRPIRLHLNIPDADLGAAITMIDTLDSLRVEVQARVMGQVGGAAVAVLAAARHRRASASALIHLSEPRLRIEGRATEVAAAEQQVRHLLDAIYFRIADVTGREVDEIRDDARRGRTLTAVEAVEYGLVQVD